MARNIEYAHFDVDFMANPKVLAMIEEGGFEAFAAWQALVCAARRAADPDHLERAGLVTVPVARYAIGALGLDPRKMVELLEKHRLLDALLEPGTWMLRDFVEHQHLREWAGRQKRSQAANEARWLGHWGKDHPQGLPKDVHKEILREILVESPNPPQPTTTHNSQSQNTSSPAVASDPGFDRFWAVYPNRKAKAKARLAWDSAVNGTGKFHRQPTAPQVIIDGAMAYAESGTRYLKHPATWLNGECWLDEPDPEATAVTERGTW